MFQLLSRAYAEAHPMMTDRSENRCGGNFLKLGSVINGADWYSFPGGEARALPLRWVLSSQGGLLGEAVPPCIEWHVCT